MDIKAAIIQYNTALTHLEDAEEEVQKSLKLLKDTAGSATIDMDGQFFQVRERKDKLYLCELKGKPRGRPVGSRNKNPKPGSKRALELEAQAKLAEGIPESTETVEIDKTVIEAVTEHEDTAPQAQSSFSVDAASA